jgi:hypothetical protein
MAINAQVKDVTLEYDAAAGGSLIVSTNMPGGVMAVRATIPIPASTGRTTRTFPLDQAGALEGSLMKLKVTSPGAFRLFSGSVHARQIGTYLDGAAGEIWETQEISMGG